MTIPLEQRIRRYQSWLRREPVDRPLIGLSWEPDVYLLPEMLEVLGQGRAISPEQIHPEAVLPYIERCYEQDAELHSDHIQPFLAGFGIPWMEAIAGCPVVADPGSLWAAPCLDSYAGRKPLRFDPENPWLRKMIEFTRALVDLSAGRFPVSLPLTRGPLDILSAMRTPSGMCLDLVDHPDEVHALLGELTDLWIGVNQAVLRCIRPFRGGYVSRMKMWAPGPAITPQNDISSIVSRATYEAFALPCDRAIVKAFPYSSFHMHATEYHQVDNLLKLPELTVIQTFTDINGTGIPLETLLATVRRALQSKPVLLGALDIPTAERCLRELPAAGLCLLVSAGGRTRIPEDHRLWLREHCTG